jgi:glycosyltransferase involved in cell wall biosynthesis
MRIALNIKPLNSLHANRGIGQYTDLLVSSLKTYDRKNTYFFFEDTLQDKVDIIHYPYFDIFERTLTISNNTKTVVTIHDLIPVKYPTHFPSGVRGTINWYMQKRSLRNVSAIITDSNASSKDIIKYINIPKNRINVVHLAVSPLYKRLSTEELKKCKLTEYNLPEKYILYVGDVNWNKNIPSLFKSFSLLKQNKVFSDLHLVLVGAAFIDKNLTESQEIQQIIKKNHIEDFVKMLGFVSQDNLVGIYNKAFLYVQPSFDEGFGLPPLEALTCGIPVVVANSGSLSEVIGNAGMYFDPYSVKDMANVIRNALLNSDAETKRKAELGLQRARLFSVKKFAEKTIHVYETVNENSSI